VYRGQYRNRGFEMFIYIFIYKLSKRADEDSDQENKGGMTFLQL
jgi:hypothetical protein